MADLMKIKYMSNINDISKIIMMSI